MAYNSCSLGRVLFTDGPVRHWGEQHVVSQSQTFILRIDKETLVQTSQWNLFRDLLMIDRGHDMTCVNFSWENKNACRSGRDNFVFALRDVHASSYFCVVSGQNKTLLKAASPIASFAAVIRLVPPHKRLLNRAIHFFPGFSQSHFTYYIPVG